jgi:hypothetical protein
VAKAQAVADVASLRRRLLELEGRASAGGLWDDPSHAAAVWQNCIEMPLTSFFVLPRRRQTVGSRVEATGVLHRDAT